LRSTRRFGLGGGLECLLLSPSAGNMVCHKTGTPTGGSKRLTRALREEVQVQPGCSSWGQSHMYNEFCYQLHKGCNKQTGMRKALNMNRPVWNQIQD
jgi:hypothetical protein